MEVWAGVAWVLGGYLAGTLPSTYLVARARHSPSLIEASRRNDSRGDAHFLMTRHLGGQWSALAATLDVLKGLAYPLAARRLGGLPPEWLGGVGVAVVVGHGWPPYARAMAGRGLSAAAGVLLALLPLEMVIAGVVTLVGVILRLTGVFSTVGFAAAPVVAAVTGQPRAYVAMGAAIVAVIVLRRLEGVGEVVRRGVPRRRAVWYRAVHDTDGPPLPEPNAPEPGR